MFCGGKCLLDGLKDAGGSSNCDVDQQCGNCEGDKHLGEHVDEIVRSGDQGIGGGFKGML
jgi:hypothetical protein